MSFADNRPDQLPAKSGEPNRCFASLPSLGFAAADRAAIIDNTQLRLRTGGEGPMRMSGSDQGLYPQCYFWVRHILPRVLGYPKVVSAMRIAGEMSLSTFTHVLRWGTSPTLVITKMAQMADKPVWGGYFHSDRIFVDSELARDFEGSHPRQSCGWYQFEITVLHELAHYGDYLSDHKDRPGEAGDEFERLAFGGELCESGSHSILLLGSR